MNDSRQGFSFSPELCSSLPSSCRKRDGGWPAGLVVFSIILLCVVSFQPVVPVLSGVDVTQPPDVMRLPEYAVQSMGRMVVGLVCSLLSALLCVALIFRSRWAATCLRPLLAVGQSFPVLAIPLLVLPFAQTLMPAHVIVADAVVVMTIWCSQFWGMVQVLCQRFYGVPSDLEDVVCCFGLTSWQKFWQLEVPFAIPALVRRTMLSMGGSWFAALYAESVVLDGHNWFFAGLGSYVRQAAVAQSIGALLAALACMLVVLVLFDQFLFRPLSVWAVRFQPGKVGDIPLVEPWFLKLLRRTHVFRLCVLFCVRAWHRLSRLPLGARYVQEQKLDEGHAQYGRIASGVSLAVVALAVVLAWPHLHLGYELSAVSTVVLYGGMTGLRVFVMVGLASLIWIPVGVWLGLRSSHAGRARRLVQYCTIFPANLFFPLGAAGLAACPFVPAYWQSGLIVLGAQWSIALGVLAGASAYPPDLLEAARNLNVRGGLWWRKVLLPGILPYYLAGLVAATSSAWNAVIAAEWLVWGQKTLSVPGLGSFMADASAHGNVRAVALGAVTMCLFMMFLNAFLWRPLSDYVSRRLKLN
ncbi:ABC transporter permease subunit [Acetobacter okinawensis]|uniref:ABC transporter permease subunit n=1 Tax=Acetobacter okinawensis TaxID=1076594 RepID=UPI00209EB016|nr:ABC transporter permease subunit [Acetobacter okinawensis]MCP1211681.1 ABC transporter permease subunit [Acetobacter okinawensis]